MAVSAYRLRWNEGHVVQFIISHK